MHFVSLLLSEGGNRGGGRGVFCCCLCEYALELCWRCLEPFCCLVGLGYDYGELCLCVHVWQVAFT